MTVDPVAAPEAETLFSELVTRHAGSAGIAALSALDTEVISIVVKLLIQMHADGADVGRLSSTVAQLVQTLPTPAVDDDETFDIRRLSDNELREFQRLNDKCADVSSPPWAIEQEPSTTPEVTQRERVATRLALWVNERAANWVHGGLSKCSALEINHLRSELNDITSPIPCRMIWRDVFMQDAEGMIEDAVRKALAAVGSDAKVVAPTPAELEPFKQISIHDHPLAPVKNGPGT